MARPTSARVRQRDAWVIPLLDPSWTGLTTTGRGGRAGRLSSRSVRGHHREPGGRDAVIGQDLLGASLVEADREGQGITAGVGDVPELAEGRHVRFAARSPQPLGHVEDDVGPALAQAEREVLRRLEPDDLAHLRQRGFHRGDRDLVVPLRVEVGQGRSARGGGSGGRNVAVFRLPVEGEADSERCPLPGVAPPGRKGRLGRPGGRRGGCARRGARALRHRSIPGGSSKGRRLGPCSAARRRSSPSPALPST